MMEGGNRCAHICFLFGLVSFLAAMDSSNKSIQVNLFYIIFFKDCVSHQTRRWAGGSDISRMIKNVQFHNVEFVIAHRLDGDVSSKDHLPAYEPNVLRGKGRISHNLVSALRMHARHRD